MRNRSARTEYHITAKTTFTHRITFVKGQREPSVKIDVISWHCIAADAVEVHTPLRSPGQSNSLTHVLSCSKILSTAPSDLSWRYSGVNSFRCPNEASRVCQASSD